MTEVFDSETKALLERRLGEVENKLGDLDKEIKDLKLQKRGLRVSLGMQPGKPRSRKKSEPETSTDTAMAAE